MIPGDDDDNQSVPTLQTLLSVFIGFAVIVLFIKALRPTTRPLLSNPELSTLIELLKTDPSENGLKKLISSCRTLDGKLAILDHLFPNFNEGSSGTRSLYALLLHRIHWSLTMHDLFSQDTATPNNKLRVLYVGSGSAPSIGILKNVTVHGLDVDQNNVNSCEYLAKKLDLTHYTFMQKNIFAFKPADKYDVVIIEHPSPPLYKDERLWNALKDCGHKNTLFMFTHYLAREHSNNQVFLQEDNNPKILNKIESAYPIFPNNEAGLASSSFLPEDKKPLSGKQIILACRQDADATKVSEIRGQLKHALLPTQAVWQQQWPVMKKLWEAEPGANKSVNFKNK